MLSGIINLKKEAGMTSHDAVMRLRRILKEKKIGHGGTLDPDVTGVLPIAVGKATRVIEYMTDSGKVYEGEITLGYSTTTEDASGEIVELQPILSDSLNDIYIDKMMSTFVGTIEQTPPFYSAVKVNGRKLYDYARAGEFVERPTRLVTISSFERTTALTFDNNLCRFGFRVACSKGTYVRTLAVDLGEKLGYPSHMSFLKRTASAGLTIENSMTLADIELKVAKDHFDFLLPIEYGVLDLPKVVLTPDEVSEVRFGRFITLQRDESLLAAFSENKVVAILEKRDEHYKPRKVLL